MTEKESRKISKFLSLVLRHKPGQIGLQLDANGWAAVDELLEKMTSQGFNLSYAQLAEVVETNDKQRFAFSADGSLIRANQGHSLKIDLGLQEQVPPEILYHGTAEKNLESIMEQGLQKCQRHHVHLSPDEQTAMKVGMRYGKSVVLKVQAKKMSERGYKFYRSENGVWLTDAVDPAFIKGPA